MDLISGAGEGRDWMDIEISIRGGSKDSNQIDLAPYLLAGKTAGSGTKHSTAQLRKQGIERAQVRDQGDRPYLTLPLLGRKSD